LLWDNFLWSLSIENWRQISLGLPETFANLDPADPQALSYVIYGWLTALQDNLVRVLME